MPVFGYKAYTGEGSLISGVLTADTPAIGRQLLRHQGYRLVEFAPVYFGWRPILRRSRRTTRQDQVAEFARQLAMLLKAGVSLVDAMDVLIRQPQGRMAPVLRAVREMVAAGLPLSDAFEKHPLWFDRVFCAAVRVGQMSGNMDRSLAELAGYIRGRQALRTRLATALAYPVILAIVGTGVVLFLMTYVVPQLLTVLEGSGKSLPAATVVLKRISDLIIGHWLLLAMAVGCIAGGAVALNRWTPGRRRLQASQLRIPVIGMLIRKSIIAQFAQMMSILLRSGVSFLESIQLVHRTTGNLVLAEELERVETAVTRGSDVAPTLADSRIFPPLVVHIVNVGQNSGELTEMLTQLRDGYESEVQLAVGKAMAVIEPALIVVMSVVVGFVVFATMMPILEATRTIH